MRAARAISVRDASAHKEGEDGSLNGDEEIHELHVGHSYEHVVGGDAGGLYQSYDATATIGIFFVF